MAIQARRSSERSSFVPARTSRCPSSAARRSSRGSSSRPTTTLSTTGSRRRGVTLRHRVENGKGLWQLKLPAGPARLELERPGGPLAPPAELLALLVGHLRGARLAPIARLRTRREGVRADGAEIVHDTVAVLDHQRVSAASTSSRSSCSTATRRPSAGSRRRSRRAGAADGESRPKVFQALDLDFQAERDSREDGSREESARAPPRAGRRRPRARSGTRLGADVEELHQMRVATRRLRAFLRAGRDLLDPVWAEPLREELRWLGGVLGRVRDLDVLVGSERRGRVARRRRAEGRKLLRNARA